MTAALSPKGWTIVETVAQDGSNRRYSRVEKDGQSAILMDCSHGETPGHNIKDFVRIAAWLSDIGLKAPQIYEEDADYLIVEDFGDVSFKEALTAGEDLYGLAVEILDHLREHAPLIELPDYYKSNIHRGHRRVIDWYTPLVRHKQNSDELAQHYLEAWLEIEEKLSPPLLGFVHVDFHVENLMFLPKEKGLKRCGILDFQGAMKGPQAYDLGNLLEDVRIDVSATLRRNALEKRDKAFLSWYRILTTQFHCRVIGQFIKMAAKDYKTGYLQYIPRTQGYIREALEDPLLKPLKSFFDKNDITFTAPPDLKDIKALVRPDAF